jgi:hypothetical protein
MRPLNSGTEFGTVKKTIYCEECAPTVQAFINDRDALHTKLAELWEDGSERLIENWIKEHPSGTLPDT